MRPGYVVLAKEKATIRVLAFRVVRFVSHRRAFAGDTRLIRKRRYEAEKNGLLVNGYSPVYNYALFAA